jgi:hypothetical protein
MPYERTGYAPWSLTREAGVESATVDGTIQIPQYGQPIIDIGFVDEKGIWQGRKSSDRNFIGFSRSENVPNGQAVLFPDSSNYDHIDMTGFSSIFLAFKPSNTGDCRIEAVMGPDTNSFANLSPINSGAVIRGNTNAWNGSSLSEIGNIMLDSADTLTADVWNIFIIQQRLAEQKVAQIQITNNSGGASTIEFAFMRLV